MDSAGSDHTLTGVVTGMDSAGSDHTLTGVVTGIDTQER